MRVLSANNLYNFYDISKLKTLANSSNCSRFLFMRSNRPKVISSGQVKLKRHKVLINLSGVIS